MGAVIDFDSIDETVFASRDYKLKSLELSQKYVKQVLSHEKNQLLEKFETHPVTRELEAGPGSKNISGTLGGYGDLYSFIGFHQGTNPTEKLRELLESINVLEPKYVNNKWVFVIPVPDRKAIILATPFPWQQGAGWAIEIEKGMSGFGHFLSINQLGRSEGGIEIKGVVRATSESVRTRYITHMLEHFRVNFERTRL